MCNELTWEQERDIEEYQQWLTEQAWEKELQRQLAQEAIDEDMADDRREYVDYGALEAEADYYDHIASGKPSDELPY